MSKSKSVSVKAAPAKKVKTKLMRDDRTGLIVAGAEFGREVEMNESTLKSHKLASQRFAKSQDDLAKMMEA